MAMRLRHPRHGASNVRPLAPLIGLGSQCLGAHDLLLATLRVGHRRYSPCLRAHGLPLATTLVGHRRHSQCLCAHGLLLATTLVGNCRHSQCLHVHGILLAMLLVGHRRHSQSCIALGRLVATITLHCPGNVLDVLALSIGQSSLGAFGAFLLVSQACESGLAQFSPGGLSGESGVEAALAKP